MSREPAPLDRSQRRTYTVFVLAMLFWLGLGAWAIYMFHSASNYARNYFDRLDKLASLPVYHPGEEVRFDDDHKLMWIGWSGPEPGFRWSGAREQIGLVFRTSGTDNWKCPCLLKMHVLYTRGTQHVTLLVHGRKIASSIIADHGTLALGIPAGIIKPNAPVGLEFRLPDAGPPNFGADNRVLGIAITDFVIDSSAH